MKNVRDLLPETPPNGFNSWLECALSIGCRMIRTPEEGSHWDKITREAIKERNFMDSKKMIEELTKLLGAMDDRIFDLEVGRSEDEAQ